MQINFHQGSELLPKSPVQTPVKTHKPASLSNIKTAATPPSNKPSIEDIDPEELFDNFSKIVTITYSNQEYQDQVPYKKLEFQEQNSKLDFDQSTASMKKKAKIQSQRDLININPFTLTENLKPTEQFPPESENQLFSPKIMPSTLKESKETFTTPTKKQLRSLELEKAAYKENPFRDLAKK